MSSVNCRGDPRIRLLGLIVLTWAHGIATGMEIFLLVAVTVLGVILYWDAFVRYLSIILMTALLLCLLSVFTWLTTKNISIEDLVLNLLRWLSMSTISLVIFSGLNALEFIVALEWLWLPSRIALALGISLRFFPVIVNQAARVITIQRLRITRDEVNNPLVRFHKLIKSVVPGLFVSVLRQIENISLSIIVQDIERRVQEYRFAPLRYIDFLLMGPFIFVPLGIIIYP